MRPILYPNNLKSWELSEKVPSNFCPEQVTIAERQGTSEDNNLKVKQTKLKTNSLCCLSIFLLLILTACCARNQYVPHTDATRLVSISFIDQNGMSETISTPDRLKEYEKVDFLTQQPYEKVLRVYARNRIGDTRAYVNTYHPNGLPKQYLEALNNRANGFYREWFPEGHLKLEVKVVGGEADINTAADKTWLFDGLAQVWDEKNNLHATIAYEKGVLQGPSLYYHPNGQIWKRIPYEKNQICGTFEIFLESGELLQTTPYINGQLHGEAKRFWNNGSIALLESYEKGLLTEGHYYDPEGSLLTQVINGTGKRAVFGKKSVCETQEYKNGSQEGEVRVFTESGYLVRVYSLKNGLKHGEEVEYFPHNPFINELRPLLSISWREGKINGVCKTWYENGILESQREISNNMKTGVSTAWYRDGSLMMIEEYDQDKLVKGDYFKMGDKNPVSEVMIGSGIATLYDPEGNFLHRVTYNNGLPDEI